MYTYTMTLYMCVYYIYIYIYPYTYIYIYIHTFIYTHNACRYMPFPPSIQRGRPGEQGGGPVLHPLNNKRPTNSCG